MKSQYGVSPDDIERSLLQLMEKDNYYASLIEIEDFKKMCDLYGHIVSEELPWKIRNKMLDGPNCVYAEIIQRDHLSMSCAFISVFDNPNAFEETLKDISTHIFRLGNASIAKLRLNSTQGDSRYLLNLWQNRKAG